MYIHSPFLFSFSSIISHLSYIPYTDVRPLLCTLFSLSTPDILLSFTLPFYFYFFIASFFSHSPNAPHTAPQSFICHLYTPYNASHPPSFPFFVLACSHFSCPNLTSRNCSASPLHIFHPSTSPSLSCIFYPTITLHLFLFLLPFPVSHFL